jgi:YbgC/YbaW family acyl-CoA thioester hydrolase
MYSEQFKLSIRDINYANHLDHLALLNYLHETRVRFLRSHGYTELDVDGQGSGLVVAELNCNYRAECFYGDEIEVQLSLELISPTRLVFHYTLYKAFLNLQHKVIAVPNYLRLCAVATDKVTELTAR